MNKLFVIDDILAQFAKDGVVIDEIYISQKTFDSISSELALQPIFGETEKGIAPSINGVPLTVVSSGDEVAFWSEGDMVGWKDFSTK